MSQMRMWSSMPWWKAGEEGMPAVIVVHGIRSCKRNHEVLLPASMLSDAGYSVLMLTLRENGDSTRIDGQFDGGITEYRDIIAAWSWINATHGVPSDRIGAVGGSGGAAIVAWAMHNEPGSQRGSSIHHGMISNDSWMRSWLTTASRPSLDLRRFAMGSWRPART